MKLRRTATSVTTLTAARRRTAEQWYAPERLARLRARRLGHLLEVARRAPDYRDLLEQAPIDPRKLAQDVLADPASLARLPLLDKAVITREGLSLLTEPADGLFTVTSSGSTGEPTQYLRSHRDQAYVSATWARLCRGLREARLRPAGEHRLGDGRAPRRARSPCCATQGLLPKVHQLSSFEPMPEQIALLRRVRPQVLSGYAITLELLADAVLAAGITDLRPRMAYSSGMHLSERCRDVVRQAFGVPAFDVYATNESGPIAWECPKNLGALHANDDTMYIEIVDDAGAPVPDRARPGRVVITALLHTAQPLIRYVVGDLTARLSAPCACGRGLGLLERVRGRLQHVIRLPGGHVLNTIVASAIFGPLAEVRRYQVRLLPAGVLQVAVVPTPGCERTAAPAVSAAVRTRLGESVACEIVVCEDIPLAPSGKFQTLVPLGEQVQESP